VRQSACRALTDAAFQAEGITSMTLTEIVTSYIRPAVTVLFAMVFCYGFLVTTIGADVFTGVATMVIIYWFKSRDEERIVEKRG
jgi:hypothetical protein